MSLPVFARVPWDNLEEPPAKWLQVGYLKAGEVPDASFVASIILHHLSNSDLFSQDEIALKTEEKETGLKRFYLIKRDTPGIVAEYLPRYRSIAFLGQGAYGQTEIVEEIDNPGSLHIRKYPITFEDATDLQFEALYLKKLKRANGGQCHPNVVCFEEWGYDRVIDHVPYMLTTHVSDNVKTLLQATTENDFNLYSKLRIIQQLLDAVLFIHSTNTAHCDLSAENVIIANTDDLYVIDFGLACDEKIAECVSLTSGRDHIADEVLSDQSLATRIQTDWYSVGILIHLIVKGTISKSQLQFSKNLYYNHRKSKYEKSSKVKDKVKNLMYELIFEYTTIEEDDIGHFLSVILDPWLKDHSPEAYLIQS